MAYLGGKIKGVALQTVLQNQKSKKNILKRFNFSPLSLKKRLYFGLETKMNKILTFQKLVLEKQIIFTLRKGRNINFNAQPIES